VLGRSEASLEGYFHSLEGKGLVRVVCMDLASVYRAIVRKHFPNALIVADRFHVIRLINHHFLGCWRDLDAVGSKNRGLLSLMPRHRHNLQPVQAEKLAAYLAERPALELIYRFKQRLCYLLMKKHRTRKQCQVLIPRLLRAIYQLRQEAWLPWSNSARPWPRGLRRSSPCGASPATTESPKVSTQRWNSSNARLTGFATSKTTACELR
jgi:transposase